MTIEEAEDVNLQRLFEERGERLDAYRQRIAVLEAAQRGATELEGRLREEVATLCAQLDVAGVKLARVRIIAEDWRGRHSEWGNEDYYDTLKFCARQILTALDTDTKEPT